MDHQDPETPDSGSDASLLKRHAGGDPRAFETLYTRYHQRVRLLAWKICRRGEWIDDVSNETWRRAYQGRTAFDTSRDFLIWMTGILRNVVREHRRKWGSPVRTGARPELDEVEAEVLVDQSELLEALNDCVSRLPPADRDIIRLRFFEGRPLRVVAEQLLIPEATLRESRLPAAVDRLRSCLQAKGLDKSLDFSAHGVGSLQWTNED